MSKVYIVSKTDLLKYMLSKSLLTKKVGIWSLALTEFTLTWKPQKAVKGQALVDCLANRQTVEVSDEEVQSMCFSQEALWILKFDGLSTNQATEVGIVIESPRGTKSTLSFNLDFDCTNNQAYYEALLIGLEILKELGAQEICVLGDSQLVLKQLIGEYKCNILALAPYYAAAIQLLAKFEEVTLNHLPQEDNWEANELA
ncbi:uncharacterized protein YpeP-like [Tripterygium wilfordii]|uniref:uncharacterized protein YpeP-like n=1 Tax=Tripterygium wilfordii TaxID=458696 RepID=UPI0018F857C5|nr:uncharacterized protein YpeP-like [Tripterygium wilfordii]